MNNLKQIRGLIRQSDFVASLGISYIDGPLLSKIENGIINPVPKDAQIIADKLGVEIADIWPIESLSYQVRAQPRLNYSVAFANGSEIGSDDIVTPHIQVGKKNAISRKELIRITGLKDRHVRRLIESARREGRMIINIGTGGYFYADNIEDIRQFYYQ